MFRRLFIFFGLLSLLLCIGILALWVRSYRVHYGVAYDRLMNPEPKPIFFTGESDLGDGFWVKPFNAYEYHLGVYRGEVICGHPARMMSPRHWQFYQREYPYVPERDWGMPRFHSNADYVYFPVWWLSVLFAITPIALFAKHFRRRRLSRAGTCPSCGYDLRASPDRCPECGTATVRPAKTASGTSQRG